MAREVALSLGNHIYLYQLLSEKIGCGKQTFATQIEEVLEAESLGAYDLGFDSTRELLEALDDFIDLTVFKGGRVYATVVAQPSWDEALAAPQKKGDGAGGKSWKKKRGGKNLKAVKPRRVKREEPVVEEVPATEVETATETISDAMMAEDDAAATESPNDAEQAAAVEASEEISPVSENETVADENTAANKTPETEDASAENNSPVEDSDVETVPAEPQPAISLTVVYDPEHANAGVTTLESTPGASLSSDEPECEDMPVPASPAVAEEHASTLAPKTEDETPSATEAAPVEEAQPAPSPAPQAAREPQPESASANVVACTPAAPAILEDYPTDFAAEVFCSGDLLLELTSRLPLGADAMGIVGEYYWIARENGSIETGRNRAIFPVRYTQAGERHELAIEMRRRKPTPLGATWAIESIKAE